MISQMLSPAYFDGEKQIKVLMEEFNWLLISMQVRQLFTTQLGMTGIQIIALPSTTKSQSRGDAKSLSNFGVYLTQRDSLASEPDFIISLLAAMVCAQDKPNRPVPGVSPDYNVRPRLFPITTASTTNHHSTCVAGWTFCPEGALTSAIDSASRLLVWREAVRTAVRGVALLDHDRQTLSNSARAGSNIEVYEAACSIFSLNPDKLLAEAKSGCLIVNDSTGAWHIYARYECREGVRRRQGF